MLLVSGLLSWWYGNGWRQQVLRLSRQLDGTMDYFSFDLLLKTLFVPYRQISAGSVDGSLEVKMRAFADKLFSRVFGAFIRLVLVVIGGITLAMQVVIGLFILIFWAIIPLLPLLGVVAALSGWTPTWK